MNGVLPGILVNIPLIFCLLAGIALIILEVFLPGFGLPGISGLILILAGIFIALLRYGALTAFVVLLIAAAAVIIAIMAALRSAAKGRMARSSFFLKSSEHAGGAEQTKSLTGKTGETVTVLCPGGFALIEGERVDVISEGAYIEKGVEVRVISEQGNRIIVREINHAQEA